MISLFLRWCFVAALVGGLEIGVAGPNDVVPTKSFRDDAPPTEFKDRLRQARAVYGKIPRSWSPFDEEFEYSLAINPVLENTGGQRLSSFTEGGFILFSIALRGQWSAPLILYFSRDERASYLCFGENPLGCRIQGATAFRFVSPPNSAGHRTIVYLYNPWEDTERLYANVHVIAGTRVQPLHLEDSFYWRASDISTEYGDLRDPVRSAQALLPSLGDVDELVALTGVRVKTEITFQPSGGGCAQLLYDQSRRRRD